MSTSRRFREGAPRGSVSCGDQPRASLSSSSPPSDDQNAHGRALLTTANPGSAWAILAREPLLPEGEALASRAHERLHDPKPDAGHRPGQRGGQHRSPGREVLSRCALRAAPAALKRTALAERIIDVNHQLELIAGLAGASSRRRSRAETSPGDGCCRDVDGSGTSSIYGLSTTQQIDVW